jgi:hypothetical protein
MSSIPPSPPPTGATPTLPPAAATATVISTDNAPQLATLTPGTVIDASAGTAAIRGQIELQTDSGTLLVKLAMTIPDGANVQLQLTNQGANPQFRVLSVNGQPVALNGQLIGGAAVAGGAAMDPRLASGAAFLATPAAGGSAGSGGPGLSSSGGAGVAGNALQPKAPGLLTAASQFTPSLGGTAGAAGGISATLIHAGGAGLPSGATFTVRIAAIQLPPGVAAGAGAGQTASTPSGVSDVGPSLAAAQLGRQAYGASTSSAAGPPVSNTADPTLAATPSAAPAANTTPQPGSGGGGGATPDNGGGKSPPTPDFAPSNGGAAPASTAAPSGEAALPRMLTAVVAPNSNGGRPLLQTNLGLVALDTSIELPPGSHVELETVGPPVLPPPLDPSAKLPGTTPPTNWPAFDEAMETLRQTDPAAAQQLALRVPQIGPRLGPALLAMTSAIQSGNVRGWIGEGPAKGLEKAGRKDLLAGIKDNLGEMRSPASLPAAGGEWLTMMIPMMFGGEIERIRMTVRRPPEDEKAASAREEDGTRFLVDVDMSRLGALQLDGLVKRKSKRFDLIVRSQRPLDDDLRRQISGIFGRSLEGLNMVGGATFLQGTPFVQPIPVACAGRSGLMI